MKILGIETSCDETAAAVVEGGENGVKVFSNVVSSQIEIHKKYGGVVPEVAAREHVLNILPVVNEALEKAGIKRKESRSDLGYPRSDLGQKESPRTPLAKGGNANIDAIAVTVGPGLITSLIVGVETARVLSYVWNVPVIGVNHIEGHIYANWLRPIGVNFKSQFSIFKPARPYEQLKRMHSRGNERRSSFQEILYGQTLPRQKPQRQSPLRRNSAGTEKDAIFPAIVLTVSGGHTMIVLMKEHGKFETVGETRDDAAGEAFDKAAKLLNIGYPGGPAIAIQAERFMKQSLKISNFKFLISNQIPNTKFQNSNKSKIKNPKFKIFLPRPMMYSKDFDFSFSGLKTALLYEIRKDKYYKKRIPEYCYEFQQAVIDVLIYKTIKAALKYNAKTVMLAGGVSANSELRGQMEEAAKTQIPNSRFQIPDLQYTTDNAAMIAAAGYYRALRKDFTPWQKLRVDANLELR